MTQKWRSFISYCGTRSDVTHSCWHHKTKIGSKRNEAAVRWDSIFCCHSLMRRDQKSLSNRADLRLRLIIESVFAFFLIFLPTRPGHPSVGIYRCNAHQRKLERKQAMH